jgi:hypothetical protein
MVVTPLMNTKQALYLIISQMEFGKCRALCGDDLKFHVQDMTGHYPQPTEFQQAMDEMKTYGELMLTSSRIGYFRTRAKNNWKRKQESLQRQIEKRLSELNIVNTRLCI